MLSVNLFICVKIFCRTMRDFRESLFAKSILVTVAIRRWIAHRHMSRGNKYFAKEIYVSWRVERARSMKFEEKEKKRKWSSEEYQKSLISRSINRRHDSPEANTRHPWCSWCGCVRRRTNVKKESRTKQERKGEKRRENIERISRRVRQQRNCHTLAAFRRYISKPVRKSAYRAKKYTDIYEGRDIGANLREIIIYRAMRAVISRALLYQNSYDVNRGRVFWLSSTSQQPHQKTALPFIHLSLVSSHPSLISNPHSFLTRISFGSKDYWPWKVT